MAVLQTFEIQAGDDVNLDFDIDVDDGISVTGSDVYFKVYPQSHGVPDTADGALIEKSTADDIEVLTSPENRVVVSVHKEDLVDMVGNYWFEMKIVDSNFNNSTVAAGIMCVLVTTQLPPITE